MGTEISFGKSEIRLDSGQITCGCSPDGAKRNPGPAARESRISRSLSSGAHSATRWLHPGYDVRQRKRKCCRRDALASTSNSIKARQPNTGPPSHDDDRKHSLSRTILQRGVIELHNRLLLNVRPIILKSTQSPQEVRFDRGAHLWTRWRLGATLSLIDGQRRSGLTSRAPESISS